MTLRLPGLIGLRHLRSMTSRRRRELGVARRAHLVRGGVECGEAVAVLDQVLLPADEVHVLQQHLDLAADEQALEGGIVDVHVLDVDLLQLLGVALDAGQRGFHVAQLALHGEGKGRHRAFHALEHVDAQQVDQAFLAVDLAEEALAAANLRAVLLRRRRPACAAARSAAARRRRG